MNIRRFRLRNPARCPVLVEPPPSEATMARRAVMVRQILENARRYTARHRAEPLTLFVDDIGKPLVIVPMLGPKDFKCTTEF